MATAPNQNLPKILRVGVIQGGRIIEEKLVKKRETVTIGASPKNTIVVPAANIPPTFPVFEVKGGAYQLNFTERMEGRVALAVGQHDFAGLRTQGLARQESAHFALPLDDSARGKISFGEITLLFQFVTPPPVTARPTLPATAKGSFLQGIDRLFAAVLMGVLLFNYGGVKALSLRPKPPEEELTLEQLPDRFAKLVIPERPKQQEKPKEQAVAQGPATEEKKTESRPQKAADDQPKAAPGTAERRQEVAQKVANKGLLKILGAAGGDGGGALEDVLGEGASSSDIASALAGAGGVGVATADALAGGGRKGGGSGEAAGIGDLSTSGGAGGAGKLGEKKAVQITGRVIDQGPELDSSDCDRDTIARYVKSRLRAIQGCYERELKRNTGLKGKIVVRFTIGETGRVSEIEIEESTLGNDAVANCIRNTIRVWMFPIKGAECPVSYPFVFSPAS